MENKCLVCAQQSLKVFEVYAKLKRVTSDSKPWDSGGELAVCHSCGTVQKIVNGRWLEETRLIYQNYEAYHQANGHEQGVFSKTGAFEKRSFALARFILQSGLLTGPRGAALDIGCAGGTFLRCFGELFPEFLFYGQDLDDRYLKELKEIKNFQKLFTKGQIFCQKFDLISLIHTFEHIEAPLQLLDTIKSLLKPKGVLFIQIPNLQKIPFDILVADHCLHFSVNTITALLVRAGFQVVSLSTEVVDREISLLAVTKSADLSQVDPEEDERLVLQNLEFLNKLLLEAEKLASCGPFGIFGTSNSSAWLHSHCADQVHFFVDEDPHRVGSLRFGKPVFSPSQVDGRDPIFFPLSKETALRISKRCDFNGAMLFPKMFFEI